jgi:membrane associated rhomboid family serine protease
MIPLRDSQPSHSTPFVTILIVAINVVIFLFEVTLDDFSRNHFINEYAMVPARFELSTLITSMFLHGGWMHLIGNMWFLWLFGNNVEDAMTRPRFLVFYLLCGVAAAALQVLTNPSSEIPMVGASGAISGVMGAYLVLFPRVRVFTLVPLGIVLTTLALPAWVMLIYWAGLQIFGGFTSVVAGQTGGVAFWAHVGGFVAGVVLIKLFQRDDRLAQHTAHTWRPRTGWR